MSPISQAAADLRFDPQAMPEYTPVSMIDDGMNPNRIVAMKNGVEVSVPHQPYEWWIDSDGNVVPLVVSTNRAQPGHDDYEDRYEKQIIKERRAKGWLKWDDLEDDERRQAIVERRADAAKRSEVYEKAGKDKMEKFAELFADKTGAAFTKAVKLLEEHFGVRGGDEDAAEPVDPSDPSPPARGKRVPRGPRGGE